MNICTHGQQPAVWCRPHLRRTIVVSALLLISNYLVSVQELVCYLFRHHIFLLNLMSSSLPHTGTRGLALNADVLTDDSYFNICAGATCVRSIRSLCFGAIGDFPPHSPDLVCSGYSRKLSHLVILPLLYSCCLRSVQNYIFVTFIYSNVALTWLQQT